MPTLKLLALVLIFDIGMGKYPLIEKAIKLFGSIIVGFIYVACSGVKFSPQCQDTGECVVVGTDTIYKGFTQTVGGGKVDILIVDDNSASMSYEQSRLADKFGTFIQNLDANAIDYHIGITTTDISASAGNPARTINLQGALQDGNLIPFDSNPFLTNSTNDQSYRIAAFKKTIVRQETLSCESWLLNWFNSGNKSSTAGFSDGYTANCPSTDERGIYAANLVLKNNPSSFLRGDADLAIIFLTNEDVRSQLYYYNVSNYGLDNLDMAQTLISNIQSIYPSKKFGIHGFIVATQACLTSESQRDGGIFEASYGLEYRKASDLAGTAMGTQMITADVCHDDYTTYLNSMFSSIQGQIITQFQLKCTNPQNVSVTLSSSDSSIKYTINNGVITFNKKLPQGSSVTVSDYKCPP